jgi:putative transposase
LIQQAQRSGARLAPACDLLGLSIRTYQRWLEGDNVVPDKRPLADRPTPHNKLSQHIREAIVNLCNQPQYRSQPPAFIVADRADNGIYVASESTLYRVLKEYDQQHHRGRQKAPVAHRPATTHRADGPNQLWCWDITWLPGPAKGVWFYLYMIMDVYSRKIVGQEVYDNERGELAADVIEKAYWREHLVGSDTPLVLHSDNGSPMKAATFLEKLYDLGITPSRSRPRVSNDNAFAESLFKTLKYRPGFPAQGFQNIHDAREWVHSFTQWYNLQHRHSGLNYVTPHQRHTGEAAEILANRKRVYEQAKQRYPERWSGNIRDFGLPEEIYLNPDKNIKLLKNVV